MKKILVPLAVCFLFASLMVLPFVSASYVCPAAYQGEHTSYRSLAGVHPSIDTDLSAFGECFTANSTGYLYNVTISALKGGTPGFLFAQLYTIQGGVVGTNAYPSSTVLATSEVFDTSVLAGSFTDVTLTFDGSYELTNTTSYAIVIQAYNATFSSTNYVRVAHSNTENQAVMNEVYYSSSTWTAAASNDMYFIINGDTTGTGATPTPTPAPTSSGSGDADMEALTAAILPFLVPLLVCLIPALLGYKFVGELGFFIGLNVGVILAYVTLGGTAYAFPLWGIILVGVMDVAVVLMRR